MVDNPAATPVTTPVAEPTVASNVLLLVHTPPEVASDNVVDDPTQTLLAPLIALGFVFTVIGDVTKHPLGTV